MSKLTYAEQLRHPLWQRKRLEVLEGAQWMCQSCFANDQTLHVHHKRYVKGRMAWEYTVSELAALCEPCHQEAHHYSEAIAALLATLQVDGHPDSISEAGAVLAGLYECCGDASSNAAMPFIQNPWGWNIGSLGRAVYSVANFRIHEISQLSSAMSDPQFVMDLRVALAASNDRAGLEVRKTFEGGA